MYTELIVINDLKSVINFRSFHAMTAGWGTALSVVVVAVVAGRAAGDTSATPGLAADRGNWTFGDCMMVTMAGQVGSLILMPFPSANIIRDMLRMLHLSAL